MAKKLTDHAAAMKHRYRLEPGGPTVPGVTTIINILDKPGLKWAASEIAARTAMENARRKRTIVRQHRAWLADSPGRSKTDENKRRLAATGTDDEVYVHWCRGEFDRQWRAKADRGNRVHDVAERWTRREPVWVMPSDVKYVDALAQFYEQFRPRFIFAECIVLNADYEYGGRFDAIAELDGPTDDTRGLFMLDWKTGGAWESSNALQFSGYLHGKLANYNADGSLGPLDDLPAIDGARNVFLRPDGSCGVVDPFVKITQDEAWDAFRACRKLFGLMKKINDTLETESTEGDN